MPNSVYDSPETVAAWHEFRARHVMASDTPKIIEGDSLSVYCDKVTPAPSEPTDEMLAGLLFEPGIARWFELRSGLTVRNVPPAECRDFAWIGATADRVASDGCGVEIKKTSARFAGLWGEPGTSQVPDRVAVQAHQQMLVYGWAAVWVPVLIGEADFRVYRLERDESVADSLVTITRDFWSRVERRDPPEPDWAAANTVGLLNRLHRPTGPEISLPDEWAGVCREYIGLGEQIKLMTEARDTVKAKLIDAMKDAGKAHVDGFTVTRRECERKSYEVKASKYIDFRIKALKGEKTV